MKRAALEAVEGGKEDFKANIFRFVRGEFSLRKEENLRGLVEKIAAPVRFHRNYGRFMMGYAYQEKDDWDPMNDPEPEEDFPLPHHDIPELVTPQFKDYYRLENMFPLTLSQPYEGPRQFVPISFSTKRGERKFMLAGLHSGGKSFFLENIVLGSIMWQTGEQTPGDAIIAPYYNRIFYFRNVSNRGGGKGKAEQELRHIYGHIKNSNKEDLIVLDEFLDSAEAEVAESMGSKLMDGLYKSEATVFISSHRAHDFRKLQKQGWTIYTPEHTVASSGKIVPCRTLRRGLPNKEINVLFMNQRYADIFSQGQ